MKSPLSFGKKLKVLWLAFTDKRTPTAAKALVVLGALYGVSPLDILPDVLPLLGQLDDVTVLMAVFFFFLSMTKTIRKDASEKVSEEEIVKVKEE